MRAACGGRVRGGARGAHDRRTPELRPRIRPRSDPGAARDCAARAFGASVAAVPSRPRPTTRGRRAPRSPPLQPQQQPLWRPPVGGQDIFASAAWQRLVEDVKSGPAHVGAALVRDFCTRKTLDKNKAMSELLKIDGCAATVSGSSCQLTRLQLLLLARPLQHRRLLKGKGRKPRRPRRRRRRRHHLA